MKRCLLIVLLIGILTPVVVAGKDLYEERLDKGLTNTDPYAYLLIRESREDSRRAMALLEEARKYSPDLPATYFEIAKTKLFFSPSALFEAADFLLQGIAAYGRNFWWSSMMTASVLSSAVLSFLVALFLLFVIRIPSDLPLLMHDVREEKGKVLLFLLLCSAFLGPVSLLGGLVILITFYQRKRDRLIFFLYVAFLIASPWLSKAMSTILSASMSSSLKAVVRVNEGRDNAPALAFLGSGSHPAEIFSHALALKREGKFSEAIGEYERLVSFKPEARTFINLANAYVALGRLERAKELYAKSLERARLPSAYYNLSQVYRDLLDFEKGEEYFLEAQKIDRAAVSRYREIYSRNPNRFVVDETLPRRDLHEYAKTRTAGVSFGMLTWAPPVFMPVLAVVFVALYAGAMKRFTTWSYRCSKCGKILCSKCEKQIRWGRMCRQCYGALIKLDEVDSKERIARLLAVYDYQNKRRNTVKIVSLFLPGWGLIHGGNVLFGFFVLWLFLFSLFLLVTNSIFRIEMSSFSHVWLNLGAIVSMICVYGLSILSTRRRLARGWL